MPYIGQGLQQGRRQLHTFTATASQTTFSVAYSPGYVDVYQNGILLAPSDYTATNGTTVVLAVGAAVNDEITIIAQHLFSVADSVSASQGGTFTGDVTMTGNLTVQGTTITVDTSTAQTLAMGDADKISLGDNADLQIYHEPTYNNSVIVESGSGNLLLGGTQINFRDSTLATTMANFNPNGSADLHHAGTKKFETTASGVTVTGTTYSSLNLGIRISSPAYSLHVHQDDSDASYALFTNTTTGTTANDGFRIGIDSNEDALIWHREAEDIIFATNNDERMRIQSGGHTGINFSDPASTGARLAVMGDAGSNAIFVKGNAGSGTSWGMGINAGSTSADASFRVYDKDGSASYVYVRGDGNVGIGVSNPELKLDISSGTTSTNVARLRFIDDNNGSTNNPLLMEYKAGLEIENSYSGSSPSVNGTKVAKLQLTTVTDSGYSASASIMGLAESGGYDAGAMVFSLGSNSSGLETEKMRLTSANGLKVISDSGNSSTADNISIVYNGTAGGHKSGLLFIDKRGQTNAAVKNDLQDDGVGTAAAHLRFQTSHAGTLTTQMTIDRYGQVMTPNQPSFRAYSSSDYTANGVLESANWTEQHDNNNDFSNGRFTAPVDGVYHFDVYWDSYQSLGGLHLLVNTGSYYVKWEPTGNTSNGWETKSYSTKIKLSSGDYVRLVGAHASGSNPFHMGSGHWGFFAGHLLG
mgnify:CR=1 FL=1